MTESKAWPPPPLRELFTVTYDGTPFLTAGARDKLPDVRHTTAHRNKVRAHLLKTDTFRLETSLPGWMTPHAGRVRP